MPEIGEVARTVHYIRKLLVGKTLSKVIATEDNNVFGKAGTSAAEFQEHMTGKKIVDAGQQGKYFWIIMSSPPHPVMHFGMSGWLKFKSEHTYYYQPKAGGENEPWPPKFVKFMIETKPENGEEAIEAAFVDMRRFARIRLVDCPASQIRNETPLKENGPDPVIDRDIVTVAWLKEKCKAKKVPIKAMLLDQAIISGIGNWVGDEIMYNAKIHPEQYANTLTDEQITRLHQSVHYICRTAVELLADSEQFPDDWLFKHRWAKGKKGNANILPNGEKIAFLTVGGRTSAVVPSVQKKTGPVAKEMSEAEGLDEDEEKPKKPKGKKRKAAAEEADDEDEEVMPKNTPARGGKAQVKDEPEEEAQPKVNGTVEANGTGKGAKNGKKMKEEPAKEKKALETASNDTGRRRSRRLGRS
ncbi:formamidopyrimidine-DNA glycosylase [Rhinocladiella mackenziei CBS 650.93]|uniref:Formamidopyrimidine-DNA glycosylase n=1 Tax=Rhinocladiella mackenziei CBS 650.93 TaxID=1442369 RepID=A0A0D2H3R1_9EURO|nr:formamidopyrimidine-DNA glycosylase [Rhinocladiella mackenziei CBS 650.93]KIX05018.1 formamidopyrimidine-DNA glycosylase [Rhinocladiella mackenziei CBS 650.93]